MIHEFNPISPGEGAATLFPQLRFGRRRRVHDSTPRPLLRPFTNITIDAKSNLDTQLYVISMQC